MCGIVGYVGPRPCQDLLISGLERLEYRGYDSAGIALYEGEDHDRFALTRSVGNLAVLKDAVGDLRSTATVGLGHTRWATHGAPSEPNAHPHTDTDGRIAVVLNGIVENYVELRDRLVADGAVFTSQTDAEVVPQLIASHYEDGDLIAAVRRAADELQGHFAFVVACVDQPGTLVAVRRECPLLVGVGDGERFVGSAIPAFLRHTRRFVEVEDGDLVVVTPHEQRFYPHLGEEEVPRPIKTFDGDETEAEKGSYPTFMLKEIHEQRAAIADTLADRLHAGRVELDIGLDAARIRALDRVVIVGCGTSYHAGLAGRGAIERWARLPVEIDVASEYRYRDAVLDDRTLVIGVTQSGETADTLAAMRLARGQGAHVVAVTNILGSQATRDADASVFTRAGLEIGVAATKTHVAQIVAMQLLALHLAAVRQTMSAAEVAEVAGEMVRLPELAERAILETDARLDAIADRVFRERFFLYMGRGFGVAVALEGALKLKEISYIPTDAYAAGEMKHGPIALLEPGSPVIVVATRSPVYDKIVSNIQEVRARGARVFAVATEGDLGITEHADETVWVPDTRPELSPVLAVLPLQLLAYKIATRLELNVDQPRNLAKTVTVE
jgi:glucosamine--fructose-6-phosphate aminotransferase (isomerizing)